MQEISPRKEAILTDLDISRQQLQALYLIGRATRLTIGEFAHNAGVTSGAATQMIDNLVAKKLVMRQPSANDRRVIDLELSPAGQAVQNRLKAVRAAHIRSMLEALSPSEIESFINIVKKIRLNLLESKINSN